MPASRLDWNAHKSAIVHLYWTKGENLPKVMKVMQDDYGFSATERQYKNQLKVWSLEKNINARDMKAMLQIQMRRRQLSKETRFTRHGMEVRPEKLSRFAKRHHIKEGSLSDGRATTPIGVRYSTPEPGISSRSLPQAVGVQYAASPPREVANVSSQDATELGTAPDIHLAGLSSSDQCSAWGPSTSPSPTGWHPPQIFTGPLLSPSTSSIDGRFGRDSPAPFTGPDIPDQDQVFPLPYRAMLEHNSRSLPFVGQTIGEASTAGSGLMGSSGHTADWFFACPQNNKQSSQHLQPSTFESPGETRLCGNHPPINNSVSWTNDSSQSSFSLATGFGSGSGGVAEQIHRGPFPGLTPLHTAVINGNVEEAKALLCYYGADPNAAAFGGITPLHYAAFQRNLELVMLLKKHQANIDAMTENNRSVLFFVVCSQDRLESSCRLPFAAQGWRARPEHNTDAHTRNVVDKLYGPSEWVALPKILTQADEAGVTPLMAAAELGFVDTVALLIRRGARPGAKDNADHTALKYAASGNHRDLVRLLLEEDQRVRNRDVNHMLKLATRNLTVKPNTAGLQHIQPRLNQGWDPRHDFVSNLIADVMVPLYQEMGVLDEVIRQANIKGQIGLVRFLEAKRGIS